MQHVWLPRSLSGPEEEMMVPSWLPETLPETGLIAEPTGGSERFQLRELLEAGNQAGP